MSSKNSIRSWLGLPISSQMAEEPPDNHPTLVETTKSTSEGMSTCPSRYTSNVSEESTTNPPTEQVVSSLEVSAADDSVPDSVNVTERDPDTTKKEESEARILGQRTSLSDSDVPVTNFEDSLETVTAHVGETPCTETGAEGSVCNSSLNDLPPSTSQFLSQDSEHCSTDQKSLPLITPTTHIPVSHTDDPPKEPFVASPSPVMISDDSKKPLSNDATETFLTERIDQQKEERDGDGQIVVVRQTRQVHQSIAGREVRHLLKSSSWWRFGSSTAALNTVPTLQARKAENPPLDSNSVLETSNNVVDKSDVVKKAGKAKDSSEETKEGKKEESASVFDHDKVRHNQDEPRPAPPALPFSTSVFSLKSASNLLETVGLNRRRSKNSTIQGKNRGQDGAVASNSEADTAKSTIPAFETGAIDAGFEPGKQASQNLLAPTKLSHPRKANFVLPQLPMPPELGIPLFPPMKDPPSLLGKHARTTPEHAGDSIVSKALGVLGSMIWSKRKPHEKNPDDGILNKVGTNGKECEWPAEVRKVAIIGIHGWFPIKLFQRVIGEPTGTSPRFCIEMRSAILHHIREHHPNNPQDPEITLIPLEGEGKVLDRVALLHAALHARPDWIEALRNADCVFIASHSQGAPVSTLLLSRLLSERIDVDGSLEHVSNRVSDKNGDPLTNEGDIETKIVESLAVASDSDRRASHPILSSTEAAHETSVKKCNSNGSNSDLHHGPYLLDPRRQRIGMLAMAGISHGPFPLLKSNLIVRYLEAEAARELFAFMDCPGDDGSMGSATPGFEDGLGGPTKRERKKGLELSRAYWKAMRDVLDQGVKVTCVASMADQVVPLYSATMHALSHPNLLRALYIDAPAAQEATSIAQTGITHVQAPTDPATATLEREGSSSLTPASTNKGSLSVSTSSPMAKTKFPHVPSASSLVTEIPGPADLDFLTNLIVFALRLRNAGLSDHGLIVHLSEAVAGSLYGTGHSTIYEEAEVYALAFKWLLTPGQPTQSSVFSPTATSNQLPQDTRKRGHKTVPFSIPTASYTPSDVPSLPTTHIPDTTPPPSRSSSKTAQSDVQPLVRDHSTLDNPTPPFRLEQFTATTHLNPFFLPWIMRALLFDPLVAAHPDLAWELQEIIRQFKNWEPREKAMRDLKYRLEPLKSHL